ncbi:MAG: beta-propeller fold lactonase family protein [Terracidiphilus sp.]|nr:beta-propeller fold lactonase family protein [Terracidiphilus sp.]
MKFNKSIQLLLVAAASLLVAGLVNACGTLTVDFVFVTSAAAAGSYNYGRVDVFEVNSESGRMRQIPSSPFPSEGRNPVAEAVSSDNTNLYVVNRDDNTIVQFVIGTDGKLYPANTVNTPGIYPMAVAVNGLNLFVVDLYQPLPTCSTAAPCSGSVGVFPINPTSSNPPSDVLGTALTNGSQNYWPLCQYGYASTTDFTQCKAGASSDVIVPTGINVLKSGAYAYVTAYDTTASPNVGYVFAFAVGSSGALTPLNDGVPFAAGVHPSAIASDSTNSYVYVTDSMNGDVLGFAVQSGQLSSLSGSPFPAGNHPSAIVVDTAYSYAYVTNYLDSTVTAYSISNGVLTRINSYATGLQPTAIGIDPSTKHFMYTANYLGNTVSGFELSTTDGTLLNSQFSPYSASAQPTAVAAIPHGTPLK